MTILKIGTKIDRAWKQKEVCRAIDAKLTKEKSKLYEMQEDIIKDMDEQKLEISGGKLSNVTRKTEDYPTVKDWNKLYAYIKRNNAWDMLQKRISSTAYKARIGDKKKVPGVTTFKKSKLLMRKKT